VYKDKLDQICHFGQRDGHLVFTVLATDEEVYPHPPVQRAMLVTEALLQQGYEIIEWQPPPHRTGTELLVCCSLFNRHSSLGQFLMFLCNSRSSVPRPANQ
jgi:hypothetical protein